MIPLYTSRYNNEQTAQQRTAQQLNADTLKEKKCPSSTVFKLANLMVEHTHDGDETARHTNRQLL